MSGILFVPGLKKNLLSVFALEGKGYRVAFVDGKAIMWHTDSSIDFADMIGVREGGLYRLTGRLVQALLHDSISLCKLWHRLFAHFHYRVLPNFKNMVIDMPNIHIKHDDVYRGCALGKNAKKSFPNSNKRSEGILDLIHSDICEPMSH